MADSKFFFAKEPLLICLSTLFYSVGKPAPRNQTGILLPIVRENPIALVAIILEQILKIIYKNDRYGKLVGERTQI